jgi:hypothetical protein
MRECSELLARTKFYACASFSACRNGLECHGILERL